MWSGCAKGSLRWGCACVQWLFSSQLFTAKGPHEQEHFLNIAEVSLLTCTGRGGVGGGGLYV